MIEILDMGSSDKGTAPAVFDHIENKHITNMDIDPANNPDIVHDISKPIPDELREKFDIVLSSHVMEHLERNQLGVAFTNLRDLIRPGGEAWVIVPSLEWCCKMVLTGNDHAGVQLALFGGQQDPYDYHKVAFSLESLRKMVELTGLVTRRAYQAPLYLSGYGQNWTSIQNIVVAMKPEPPEGTQDGIDSNPV